MKKLLFLIMLLVLIGLSGCEVAQSNDELQARIDELEERLDANEENFEQEVWDATFDISNEMRNDLIRELREQLELYKQDLEQWEDDIEYMTETWVFDTYRELLEKIEALENENYKITFDLFDDYWLVEIVSREPFGDDGYYYQIKVVGTSEYAYQVSRELFSIGELVLAIEFEDGQVVMIDFNN